MKKTFLALFLLPHLLAGGGRYYQTIGTEALAEVKCDWRTLLADWNLNFLPGKLGYLGMTYKNQRRIDIWVRPGALPSQVAAVVVHELAHRVDYELLTAKQHTEWYTLRGIPQQTPWYPLPQKTDYNTGAGDFAECVKWTIQGPGVNFKSHLGPPPTETQQQAIRKWLAQVNLAGE